MFAGLRSAIEERLQGLPDDTRRAWGWDVLSGVFAGVYQGAVWTFVYRVARADLQVRGTQMAWIAAAPAVGYIFATLWARQMEGKSKLPFVYWTWLIARGLFVITPFLQSTGQFVALVCITPILFSVSTPAYTAVMKEIYPDRHRGRLMSTQRMVLNGFMLVAAQVMGRLLDHGLSYKIGFAIGGGFGALSAWAFSKIPMPAVTPSAEGVPSAHAFLKDTVGILKRNPGFRWFSASVFVSGFGNIVAVTLYPIYQVDRFHVTNHDVANLQNIAAISTIAGFFFWGGFMDRRGSLATVLVSLAANLLVPLLYAAAWDVRLLYAASAASGMAVAGVDIGYLNTTLMFAEPGKAAQYQALHSSFFGIRGTIAPQCAIPMMHGVGAQHTFLISLAIMVVGVGLQLISMRDFRRQAAHAARAAREPAFVEE